MNTINQLINASEIRYDNEDIKHLKSCIISINIDLLSKDYIMAFSEPCVDYQDMKPTGTDEYEWCCYNLFQTVEYNAWHNYISKKYY